MRIFSFIIKTKKIKEINKIKYNLETGNYKKVRIGIYDNFFVSILKRIYRFFIKLFAVNGNKV